jgi:cytochrome c oxidase subunit II
MQSWVQSALEPAGREAHGIAQLFTWMTVGTLVIWAAVIGLALYAARSRARYTDRTGSTLVLGGGVIFPLVVLTTLLVYGHAETARILTPADEGSLSLEVTGSQWWWRVRYVLPGRDPVELANDIRLPVGRRVNVRLTSTDVIHSFWIPPLAGKMDMIPGRINRLPLEPTRTGTFRGACAEYCGTSHALMNFTVVVVENDAFETWLANQARPAAPPSEPLARRGEAAFLERGCNTCHTIRGTRAVGVVGPDLTHVGSRPTIAAGVLETRVDEFERWIAHTEVIKPDVRMPAFATLPDDVLAALAAYLAQLQ